MWPPSPHSSYPLWVAQPYTQPSSEAVSSLWPSGEKAEELTEGEHKGSPILQQETPVCLPLSLDPGQPQTLPQDP